MSNSSCVVCLASVAHHPENPRYYDTDKNMRLTYDELEAFFTQLFGEVTPNLPAAFELCKYQSSATQGRDAGSKLKPQTVNPRKILKAIRALRLTSMTPVQK